MMHTYLALGDSYTIGEGVPLHDSFPYQTVQLLRGAGHAIGAPEIVAKTGWTTDELAAALLNTRLLPRYDLVTLLIGVNNQYRGRAADEYERQFEMLLGRAKGFGDRVIVLSIPDWGVSPFAADRDKKRIAAEIDGFNTIAAKIAAGHHAPFIDITTNSRSPAGFAPDGLHPARETYAFWARHIAAHAGQ